MIGGEDRVAWTAYLSNLRDAPREDRSPDRDELAALTDADVMRWADRDHPRAVDLVDSWTPERRRRAAKAVDAAWRKAWDDGGPDR